MTTEHRIQRLDQQRPAAAPADPDSPTQATSDVSRRAADLARIAQQAWEHCTDDVDIEAELEARRNASGQ